MEAVKAYYDGHVFVPMFPVKTAKNRAAIITMLDNEILDDSPKNYVQYAGKLSDDAYRELTNILQDTGKIDENDW
jgi:hypothetical protein